MTDADRARLRAQLRLHEAARPRLYDDATGKTWERGVAIRGNPTIGVGRNLARPLSYEAMQFLLEEDIDDHERELVKELPWVAQLDPIRLRVLIDMAFNLGVPGLLEFEKFLRAVRAGQWPLAATEMMASRWGGQVGSRAVRLRRMMLTGEDSADF